MNIKEAMKGARTIIERQKAEIERLESELDRLKSTVKTQGLVRETLEKTLNDMTALAGKFEGRLKRYEKPCPTCRRYGLQGLGALDVGDCPNCDGSGRVPRVLMSNRTARRLYELTQSRENIREYLQENLKQLPDGTWELEKVKE